MEWFIWLLLILGGLLFLLGTGLPVAFSFLVLNLICVYVLWGGMAGLVMLVYSVYTSVATFTLVPVLFFILMGEVLFQSGVALNAVDVVEMWLGRVPGRLCLVSIGAATLFSSLSGSSMGTTALLGTTLLPEMRRRGYNDSLAIGTCMSGGLAMIIPPSALAILLASISQISVGAVLIGGLIPGLILAVLYIIYILGRCFLNPTLAPSYEIVSAPLKEKLIFSFKYTFPMAMLIFIVVGLIFLGIATPTESSGLGALAAFFLALKSKKLNWSTIKKSVRGTLHITVMMFTIVTGSVAFSQVMAYSGATAGLVEFASSLPIPSILLLALMQLVMMGFGTFMEPVAIMMVSMPIFMPIVKSLGFSEIWFALITLITMEISMKTPPFGFLLFVMRGILPSEIRMIDIYKATFPFVILDMIGIAIIMIFPSTATILPNLMIMK